MTTDTTDFILIQSTKYENNKVVECLNFDQYGKILPQHFRQFRYIPTDRKEVYDDFGKLIEEKSYRDGKLAESYCYEYDNKGNLIKMTCFDYKNKGNSFSRHYEYDSNGNKIKEISNQENLGYEEEILSYYNENNKLIKIEFYRDKVFSEDCCYEWDESGNCIVMIAHSSSRRLNYRIHQTFHNQKKIEEKYFGGNGHLYWTRFFVYNKDGFLIEKNTYDNKSLFHRIITTYDENNHKILIQTWLHKDCIKKWYYGGRNHWDIWK
jgi:hypothetical protein